MIRKQLVKKGLLENYSFIFAQNDLLIRVLPSAADFVSQELTFEVNIHLIAVKIRNLLNGMPFIMFR
jgi:hypothetical protein